MTTAYQAQEITAKAKERQAQELVGLIKAQLEDVDLEIQRHAADGKNHICWRRIEVPEGVVSQLQALGYEVKRNPPVLGQNEGVTISWKAEGPQPAQNEADAETGVDRMP